MIKEYKTPITEKSVFVGPDVKEDVIILAIESSCDETACAIVKNGREVLANVVASQIKTHREFGGVVPEVAAREHLDAVNLIITEAFEQSGLKPEELTAIAATVGPGLVGCLLVGMNAAKALAVTYDKPFIGVNHLNAHVCANYIDTDLKPPFVALLVSGGHTQIIKVDSYEEQSIIGETIDDATGEAYDKVARLLGLPYPGGLNLDRMAPNGNPNAYSLPIAKVKGDYDFSFSGLKTAVLQLTQKLKKELGTIPNEDVAASFQECITKTLFKKTLKAAVSIGAKKIALGGGVAANSEIRKKFFALEENGYKIYAPAMKYCTDNASMVASAAYFSTNTFPDLGVEVFSRCS
ncbi:MAG: tRNA (adenosine(37)-N6)-threonylcarbamoyltransferase complex transferase subunit TsaD [Candidatus Gastranaerophilales bacterium]|nr:tRNA (adenosine(37)-N6)-threonylcarbamoyltransferase complex transferase subunit TsaD [Candidatus Gastranaerophilales bacterium]